MKKKNIATLEDLALAVVAKIHHLDRNCRCANCHEFTMQCLDCPKCRKAMEEKVLEVMRSVNHS